MVLAIPLTVKLARQQQILFSRAAAAQIVFLTKDHNGTITPDGKSCVTTKDNKKVTLCSNVKFRLVAPTGADIKFQSRTSLLPTKGVVSTAFAQCDPDSSWEQKDNECVECNHSQEISYNTCTDEWWKSWDDSGHKVYDTGCASLCASSGSTSTGGSTGGSSGGTGGTANGGTDGSAGNDGSSDGGAAAGQGSTGGDGGDSTGPVRCEGFIQPTEEDETLWCDGGEQADNGDCKFDANGDGVGQYTTIPCTPTSQVDSTPPGGGTQGGCPDWQFKDIETTVCGQTVEGGVDKQVCNYEVDTCTGTTRAKAGSCQIVPGVCDAPAGDPARRKNCYKCVQGKFEQQSSCPANPTRPLGECSNSIPEETICYLYPNSPAAPTACGSATRVSCNSGSDSEKNGGITAAQARCVINKRKEANKDILPVYQQSGWCTEEANYRAIVNNWYTINSQEEKNEMSQACSIGSSAFGGPEKCFVCDTATDGKSRYRYAGDGALSGCPTNASVCDPKTSATCKGPDSLKGNLCNTAAAPVISKYRFAEDKSDLENLQKAKEGNLQQGEAIVSHIFSDTPGEKFIWYQFGDGAGNWTEARSDHILLVGADPKITGASCNLDITDNSLKFQVIGDNFGARDLTNSRLAADSSNLEIKEWANQKVVARMANPPDTTTGKTYTVTLTRSDGTKDTASCSVNTTQISLGAKLFCRAPSNFDQDNVNLLIVQNALGVGTTVPSSDFKSGNKAREKVTITKEGIIQNLKTKLQEGIEYIVCIKAPKSLRLCTKPFPAVAGNNIIHRFDLPVGDVNDDEAINSADASICKAEWGPARAGRAKACEFNRDNVTNSFEWSCLLHDFNAPNQQEPI